MVQYRPTSQEVSTALGGRFLLQHLAVTVTDGNNDLKIIFMMSSFFLF